ncbi:hypothetical protein [Actinacidiphila acididurans]|uniref:Uncharacterized protein n=1 Tax=Actinacidiphila acididurans TaxID=2784346 RepID=A0ABS2TZ37_9ACTN|nr:hypothetical protein [Actinacidiphila acididurans]MBM9508590.1 hypothetical protein [Actinacidiphila acididurans]
MIRADFVPDWALRDAFTQIGAMMLLLGAGSVGGMALSGEYGTGLPSSRGEGRVRVIPYGVLGAPGRTVAV